MVLKIKLEYFLLHAL
jgi:hypothetical protein